MTDPPPSAPPDGADTPGPAEPGGPAQGASARWGPLVPWGVGLAAGGLVLGPVLGPGLVLRYDMVFVPDPPLSAVTLGAGEGFPRAVPSDAVVGLLARLFPADAVQAVLLLAVFVLGAAGAARLVPAPRPAAEEAGDGADPVRSGRRGPSPGGPPGGRRRGSIGGQLPRVAAGVFYVWNPFVAERLLLGQWALLLGYAGLPWVVAAAVRLARGRDLARMVVALVPAAIGGFSSLVLSALVAVPAALLRRGGDRPGDPRDTRAGRGTVTGVAAVSGSVLRALPVVAALAVVALPWLVPALGSGARTDPAAVDAFAARADSPFGTAASLLALGGIWNAQAVPEWYGAPLGSACRLVLSLAALAGWVWLVRRGGVRFAAGLSAAAAAGFAIALLGTAEPGRDLLRALIGAWPGFGPLRDGQLYVAPLALLQAVGFGGAVAWAREAMRADPRPGGPVRAAAAIAAALALAPVVALPGLAWGAAGRLVPVEMPAEWAAAQRIVAADERPGAVLVLPWSAYRGLDWAGDGRTVVVLDPAVKLFDRRVVWNDDLRVGDGGELRVIEGEDPLARTVERAAADGRPASGGLERLGAAGIRYVLVEREAFRGADAATPPDPVTRHLLGENVFSSHVPGASPVHDGPRLALFELPDEHVEAVDARLTGLEVTGWSITVGAIFWSIAASGSSLISMRPAACAGVESRKEGST
ncbi:hypothetical protein ACFOVU_03475 [Nocardiopsis sediminis]|uniref:YfhO family protein n=1 Tax=Nocardiopsis sediminis TaxID=1778267 RepID=A0ABV8FHU8_9ACTN